MLRKVGLTVLLALTMFACSKGEPPAQAKAQPPSRSAALGTGEGDACQACRKEHCSNYQGLFDLVKACFEHQDPTFVAACKAAVKCARDHRCGYKALGASECFCGSAQLDACQTPGAANGPCQKEWFDAARSDLVQDVSLRFSDVTYPAGVANYLVECDRNHCPSCLP